MSECNGACRGCLIGRIEDLEAEIARLRLTDAEREAVGRAIITLDDWQRIGGYHELHDDDAATLRGLLERLA